MELNVIDVVAKDIEDLLNQIDGRQVETVSGLRKLNTKNAVIVEVEMSFTQKILSILSDPNLAYISDRA